MLAAPPSHPPDTTRRAGKPWSGGNSSPFIAHATMVSSASALANGSGRLARIASSDSGTTSQASVAIPATSSTSRNRTPVHSAVPIAVRPPLGAFEGLADLATELHPPVARTLNGAHDGRQWETRAQIFVSE